MSERWKYQIKSGGFWGLFMIGFTTIFGLKEMSFMQQISTPNFYIRVAGYLVLGIFVLGYINWRAKVKNENKQ